jgi:hypothetical protein
LLTGLGFRSWSSLLACPHFSVIRYRGRRGQRRQGSAVWRGLERL